jgi:hypothetical protein
VISACKSYIDKYQDYPKDLLLIYLEKSSTRAVFETLSFLDPYDPEDYKSIIDIETPRRTDRRLQKSDRRVEEVVAAGEDACQSEKVKEEAARINLD